MCWWSRDLTEGEIWAGHDWKSTYIHINPERVCVCVRNLASGAVCLCVRLCTELFAGSGGDASKGQRSRWTSLKQTADPRHLWFSFSFSSHRRRSCFTTTNPRNRNQRWDTREIFHPERNKKLYFAQGISHTMTLFSWVLNVKRHSKPILPPNAMFPG